MSSVLRTLIFMWTKERGDCAGHFLFPSSNSLSQLLLLPCAVGTVNGISCLPAGFSQWGDPTGDQRADTE